MRDSINATVQTFVLPQRPFLKTFPKLMEYGGIKPSYEWDGEEVRRMRFERARRNKLKLALVQFARWADFSFDVDPFMRGHKMRHVDLVELVLFAQAHGSEIPEKATVGAYGESFKMRCVSNIPWFTPRLLKEKGELILCRDSPGRGILQTERMLVAYV